MMIMIDFWVVVLKGPVEFIRLTVSAQNRPVIDIHLIYPFSRFASAHPLLDLQATYKLFWEWWSYLMFCLQADSFAICSKFSTSMNSVLCTCTPVRARMIWNSIFAARTSFLIQSSSLTGGEAIYALYILYVSTLFTVESGQNLVYTVHSPVRPCTILCTVLSVQNIVFFVHSALPCTALHSLVHSAVYCTVLCTVLNTLLP